MGERRRGHKVRKYEASQGAPPSEQQSDLQPGFDRRGNSAPYIRASGWAHNLTKAPSSSTHRLYRAGHTLPPAAVSDFNFPFLPREQGVPAINFIKEKCHDQSNSARSVL
jgi:hypothetical protein